MSGVIKVTDVSGVAEGAEAPCLRAQERGVRCMLGGVDHFSEEIARLERVPMQNESASNLPLPPNVRTFWLVVVVTTFLSVLFCLIARAMHAPHFYASPLSTPDERYGDLTIYVAKFRLFHTAAFFSTYFPFTYPAPVSLIYLALYRVFGVHAVRAFNALCALACIVPAVWFGVELRRRAIGLVTVCLFVATLLLTSWPAILVADRANMEITVWIVMAFAMWAFATGRGYAAAVLFGIAASLKLFPFVFLALFLSRRQYRQLFVGAGAFALSSIVGLALLGPTIPAAYRGISAGLQFFKLSYMMRWNPTENGVDHSLFALVKGARIFFFHVPVQHVFSRSLSVYLLLTAVGGVVLYFARIRTLPVVNQVLLLSIASIYLTPFSGDGTLLHLYYPFAMLTFVALRSAREGVRVPGLGWVFVCFGLLFSEETFLVNDLQRFEGQFKCLVLTFLFVTALRLPFGPPVESERNAEPLRFEPPARATAELV